MSYKLNVFKIVDKYPNQRYILRSCCSVGEMARNSTSSSSYLFVSHFRRKEVLMSFKIFQNCVHILDDEFASLGRERHAAQYFRHLDEQPEEVDWPVDE